MKYIRHVQTKRYRTEEIEELKDRLRNKTLTVTALVSFLTACSYLSARIALEKSTSKRGRKVTTWVVEHVFSVPPKKFSRYDQVLSKMLSFTALRPSSPYTFFWHYSHSGNSLHLHLFIPRPLQSKYPEWQEVLNTLRKFL